MKCNPIRDVILTDYIDGQLSKKRLRQVEEHLFVCPDCRLLVEKLRGQEDFLNHQKMVQPDVFLWQNIKKQIEVNQTQATVHVSIFDLLRNFVYSFRPAIITICIFFVLGTALWMGNNFSHHESYLTSLLNSDAQTSDEVSGSIEKYFL